MNNLRIKTIGLLIIGTIVLISALIANLAYISVKTSQRAKDLISNEATEHNHQSFIELTSQIQNETIITSIIIVIASLACVLALLIRVIRPLSRLQRVMSTIAVGDYSIEVPGISKQDEIGEMARSLEILRDDAEELENVKEEQLITERKIALAEKEAAEEASRRLIEEEKLKRQTQEIRSNELAAEVEKQTRELRKSETSLRGIIDSVLDAFISANNKGEILSFNKSAEAMFGYTAEEAIGQSIHMLVPESFRQEHEEIFSKTKKLDRPVVLGSDRKIEAIHKNGKTFPVYIGLTKLHNDDESIFVAVLRDISDEVKSEQKLQRLGRLLDRSMREIYVLDAENFGFQEVNTRALDVLGYNTQEFESMNYEDILSSPTKAELKEIIKPLRSGEKEEVLIEGSHICKDGSIYPVEIYFHYWTNEDPPVYLAVVHDMTKRLKVRQEILDARDAAESASKAKSFFLANMSHELRTPLNAVLGYSEMLKEIAEENSHNDYADDLDKISIAAEHLLTLINDILDLSKITSGKADIVRHKVDVLSLVNEAGTLIGPLVQAGHNELVIDAPDTMAPMYSDEVRIRQVLINILSNASKFTEDGTISLKVEECKVQHQEHLKLTITDTGVGIPEDKIESIFDEFTQVNDEREKKPEGSGLGLSICRRLCHAMLGEITLKSEIDVGTSVCITLPMDIEQMDVANGNLEKINKELTEHEDQNHIDQSFGQMPQKRIVIIEDNHELGQLMKAYLEVEDYEVELAQTGQGGIQLIDNFKPSTVLLDMSLPDMDGAEAMNLIQRKEGNSNIRIIVCSGGKNGLKNSVIDTDNYLLKPVDKNTLLKAVRSRELVANGTL